MPDRMQSLIAAIETAGRTPASIPACDLAELQMICEDMALYIVDWCEVIQRDNAEDADLREEVRLLRRWLKWAKKRSAITGQDGSGKDVVPWPSD